jgi:excinuclease ABC subunit A
MSRSEGSRRTSIEIRGARVHNLQNVSLEIPRDQLTVVTGLSGSGKSSLAFDTVYAEAQRRYMESLSSYARRFVDQVAKPDVDFMFGLSPVISIEQKTIASNPRSTVGTMTDIASYLNLLFATIGTGRCPRCEREIPVKSSAQIADDLVALPAGATVELRAPVWKVYDEDHDFLFTELRKKGYRHLLLDGKPCDISEELELDESSTYVMDVVTDALTIRPGAQKELATAVRNALLIGDPYLQVEISGAVPKAAAERFYKSFGCPVHHTVVGDLGPAFFMFNDPQSACRTCLGLGNTRLVHPELLVPDPARSIREGCFTQAAFRYDPDNWDGRNAYSMSLHYGFSLDEPWQDLPEPVRELFLHGTKGEKFTLVLPPEAKTKDSGPQAGWRRLVGKPWSFGGIVQRIERGYRRYREKQVAQSGWEAWLEKVMVEHTCPDCGGARVKASRRRFHIADRDLHEFGELHLDELRGCLDAVKPAGRNRIAGQQILREIKARLDLLLGIGLDYLSFNRRSATLSGGESQRIRLSTQIGSGLMGMLYVLDEPSIGLHPKDNAKMIATLERLRDLGNTVIVVEHDPDTIRAADHVVEMGPGPGVHGGRVVVQGKLAQVLSCPTSPTGQFLSGARSIELPGERRKRSELALRIRGARENNLRNIDVEIPLGLFVCITGASGSGKSTLVHEILHKQLQKRLHDSRILPGAHAGIDGIEAVQQVTHIDQSPLGRNSRSNPATYIGFYDEIRDLFARTELALERDYKPGRFSFNVATGRCAECSGDGTIQTQLYFMPDVEVLCESCKGARFNPETLEVTYKGKNIAEVLDLSIEEGVRFFADVPAIARKIAVLDELGLGYLRLGQSSTTLSGGEAQRVKLAGELAKLRRGAHTLYILDEPTTGLHLADIERLLQCLNRLVAAGHTVLVIEHQLDVIKTADWVIDLGPEGGHAGGDVVATGTPEQIAAVRASHTGRYLREYLAETRSTVRRPAPKTARKSRPAR